MHEFRPGGLLRLDPAELPPRVMTEFVPWAARMTRAARHLELVAWNLTSVHSLRA
jgi:hypothetical protein